MWYGCSTSWTVRLDASGADVGIELGRACVRCVGVAPLSTTDEQLIRQLYAEHAGVLFGYARRLLGGDDARAEDVVQETLLRAWRHPEALEKAAAAGTPVRAWLVTVARNLVIDGERARRARPQEVPETSAHRPVSDPDAPYDHVLVAHEIADVLEALSPAHRAVIDQLFFQDRSVAEAAAALGVPVGTIKSRAYYAMRALRAACEERGVLR